ncbi:MAG: sugar ABC transporter substrate-binding protein [Caldilinea sp.]
MFGKLVVLVLLMGMLVSCTASQPAPATSSEAGASAVESAPSAQTGEETTLTFMGWIGLFEFYLPAWEYMIAEFEKQNPGVKIEYIATPFEETLNQATTAVLGNNAPDIFQLVAGWTPQMNGMGALAALEPLFDADVLNGIPEGMRNDLTLDGELKAMPWVPAPIVMVYNRTLMEEAGLDPDSPPATWEEFVAAVEAICALPPREDGSPVYGVSLRTARHPNSGHWSIPVIWGFGGDVLTADGEVVVDQAAAVNAYQWYQDVVTEECSPNGFGVQESRTVFGQGRAGFIFEGPWIKGLVQDLSGGALTVALDGDVWAAPMPAGPDGAVHMIANSHALGVSATSPHQELAAKFVEFITTDPAAVTQYYEVSNQLSTAQAELLTSGAIGEDEYIQIFVAAAPVAQAVPIKHPQWNAMTDSLSLALQKVLQGDDPAGALAEAAREITGLLEDE